MPGLRISRVLSRDFDGRSETSLDPDLRTFVSDLTRPYGVPLREDLLREGVGHSYGEMAEGLLREALPDGAEPVDLLVMAFDVPDVRPGRSTSVHLSSFCPGTPLAFAICDQGSAAAFTALRIASDYLATGAARRAVVLLAEQTALHHLPPEPVRLPDRHCAVVLVCERAEEDTPSVTVRQQSGPELDPLGTVRTEAKELGPGTAVLLSHGLAVSEEAAQGRGGQPLTGVWTELAARLPVWQAEGRAVLVADLDRGLGRLSTLTLPGADPTSLRQ